MRLLITFPRCGSHLLAEIMGLHKCEGLTKHKYQPRPLPYIVDKLERYENIWIHHPYNEKLLDWLSINDVECHLLVRDPRDVIVSWSRVVDEATRFFWNYKLNGRKLTNYNQHDRIDYFINKLDGFMHNFDKWRTTGLFKVHHYADIIHNPVAKRYTFNKVRGEVGSHKDEMTADQIARANEIYKDLIESW